MNQPTVSVVIPCYNHRRYLDQAITSVLRQTVPVNEIIVVDDGSSDGTPEWVESQWGRKIRLLQQVNSGPARARNHGLELVTSKYVGFLDADDQWSPHFIEQMTAALSSSVDSVVVGCLVAFIDEDSQLLTKETGSKLLSLENLLQRNAFSVSASLYNAQRLRALGGFDESLVSVEDWEILLRIAKESLSIIFVDRVLVEYRVLPMSLSRQVERTKYNSLKMLDRFFADAQLPPHIALLRQQTRAQRILDAAVGYFRIGQDVLAFENFRSAIETCPSIAEHLDTWFAVICAKQHFAFWGSGQQLDIDEGGQRALRCLEMIKDLPSVNPRRAKAALFSSLGRLAYMQDHKKAAMQYWSEALRSDYNTVGLWNYIVNICRTLLGREKISNMKRLYSTSLRRIH